MSRFRQAISEGDGISVIPLLAGDVAGQAALAESAGAEAVAVASAAEAEHARARTGLAIVVGTGDPRAAAVAGADACILRFEDVAGNGDRLETLYAEARELGLDCAIDVRDEDELEEALGRVDPEIVVISERDRDADRELERTLDLLADVPAGKLVIADSRPLGREQVATLERAGVDAILVSGLPAGSEFAADLEELVRGSAPGR